MEREEMTESFLETEKQYLTFSIGHEVYGINIMQVKEIIRMLTITAIPETFNFIKGVINLRGQIIPVMDVRKRFNIPEKEWDDRTCIIVVNLNEIEMGLIVDNVNEVVEISPEQIDEMPSINNSTAQKYVRGIGKIQDSVKILLNLEKLLFDDREPIEMED